MKLNKLLTLLIGLLVSTTCYSQAAKPNIVFIMADDLGWSDMSTGLTNMNHPSSHFETPMLEVLAEQGVAFDNAYVNGPNCSPSRTSLLSGQYAQRRTNNVYLVGNLNRGGDNTMIVGPRQGTNGVSQLPAETVTLAETLKTAGYRTGHVGKYHVGGALPGNSARRQGFDYNYGGTGAGHPEHYHARDGEFLGGIGDELNEYANDYTQTYVDNNIKPYAANTPETSIDALVGTPKNVTDALADASIDFMEIVKSEPFYLQLHQYAVHAPISGEEARADLLEKYRNKENVDDDGDGFESDSYGAINEGMDQCIARVVNYLQNTEDPRNPNQMLSENTLVIFLSDNGGVQNIAYNGPLRGQKGELLEGGIRVPLIMWSENPSLVNQGVINSTPVMGVDFYPTFSELAGANISNLTLDGESLVPMMTDESKELTRQSLFWHLPGYLIGGARNLRPQSIIRRGDWKLRYNYESQDFNLYNLASDISESTDLSSENPTTVFSMASELILWLEELDSPLGTLREGQTPLEITIDGVSYANGKITEHNNETITINSGEEIPFVLQSPKTNISLNKRARASSRYNSTYSAAKAVDGDDSSNSSRWVSARNASFPQWIEIDFGQTKTISQVSFSTGYDGYNTPLVDFSFQYWDGTNWTDLVSENNNSRANYSSNFPAQATNRVRLLINEVDGDFIRLYELEVFNAPLLPIVDNFESGNLSGGLGWTNNWDLNRKASISEHNRESNDYTLKLIKNGRAIREMNLSGRKNLWVNFDAMAYSFESGDYGLVEIHDGNRWQEIYRLNNGDDDSTYHPQSIDLSDFTFSGTSHRLRAKAFGNGNQDFFYLDNINIIQSVNESSSNTANSRYLPELSNIKIDDSIGLYPNPSSNVINIIGVREGQTIEIFNMNGAKVINSQSHTIDTSSLRKGIYLIKVNGQKPIKFIKQ